MVVQASFTPSCTVSASPSVSLQIRKLEEALEASNQELEKSKEVLKTNENGESLNYVQLTLSQKVVYVQTFAKHSVKTYISQEVRL